MKPWARWFYKSKAWERTRAAYIAYRHGLCERCGAGGKVVHHKVHLTPVNIHDPEVALSFDNLELLCQECHNQEHHVKLNKSIADKSLTFDDEGNIVRVAEVSTRKVYVIAGPPLAGKTTYALENMERGDLLVDLDYIFSAISGLPMHDKPAPLLRTAFDVRDALYDHIEQRRGDWSRAWVIATLPEKQAREELVKRLRAELILLVPSKEECLRRLDASDRPDKTRHAIIVNDWFERYEP